MTMYSIKTATTRSRVAQRDSTRRSLVAAGLRVIADRGFARTTTADIAKATGKSHGTVFAHFPTRTALITELVREIGSKISRFETDVSSGDHSVDAVLQAHLAALAGNEALYAHLLGELATLPLSARAQVFALQSGIAARLRTALTIDGRNARATALDLSMISNMWIGLTNHYLMNRDLFAPGESVIARHGDALRRQFLTLIGEKSDHVPQR